LKVVDICALPDGRVVTIRPIRPDDVERLRLSHERLSPESRYRRFMVTKPHLTEADAEYLVHIDGCDHYALVATVDAGDSEDIVGVARFVRVPDDEAVAEFAIVVRDEWQHQGLGGELLGRLADAAVTRGVRRFMAFVFPDNLAIHRSIERLAVGPVRRRREGNAFEVDFDLPTRDDIAPAMIAACAGS
jgi:RimJ/RimL family protein N-acetyltransferase